LANYANQGNREAAIREAQTAALELDNTAMVVTLDIGEDANVHFANKQDVGKRLAMAAQNVAYNETDIAKSGPIVKKIKVKANKTTIRFNEPLNIKGNAKNINGFLISDDKNNFIKAEATLTNTNTIEVWSKSISNPKYVRYLWEDAPGNVMVFNTSGLPAPPFRTDK
jgi:sialate O-acetylesterase